MRKVMDRNILLHLVGNDWRRVSNCPRFTIRNTHASVL